MTMLRSIFKIVLIATLFSNTTFADDSKPNLYEIKSKSTKIVVGYLLGTNHVLSKIASPKSKFWNYFNSADHYASESDSSTDELDKFIEIHKYKKPNTKTLDELLTKKEIQNLNFFLKGYSDAEKQKFLYTHSAFGVLNLIDWNLHHYMKIALKMDPEQTSIDEQLEKRIKSNTPVDYLDLDTDEYLKCSLQTDEQKNIKKLKLVLKQNNLSLLKNGKKIPVWPSVHNDECIVTGRNLLWLPKILTILKTAKSTFIFVGAAHVSGEEPSLTTLLQKNGYEINLIKY